MLIADADLHLTIVRYMHGQGELAVQALNDQIARFGGHQLSRRIGALAFMRMLSADLPGLVVDAQRMRVASGCPDFPS